MLTYVGKIGLIFRRYMRLYLSLIVKKLELVNQKCKNNRLWASSYEAYGGGTRIAEKLVSIVDRFFIICFSLCI
jgi:hypothetical protein